MRGHWVVALAFPRNRYVWWSLLSWKWLGTCLPMGRSEFLMQLCLQAQFFPFLLNHLYLNTEFSHFYPSDSFPCPTGGEWASGCVGLSCLLDLNHSRVLNVVTEPVTKLPMEKQASILELLEIRNCFSVPNRTNGVTETQCISHFLNYRWLFSTCIKCCSAWLGCPA